MHSSISSFERTIPDRPWRGIAWATALIVVVATIAWEMRARALGYGPTLNETTDLWAQQRQKVKPDSIVIIGDSRAWFDIDLDEMEKGLGTRPIQLAIPGACAFPVLTNLVDDPTFHGTIVCSILPAMWVVPSFAPPFKRSEAAINRYKTWNYAQRWGHQLGMMLEERLAFLRLEDLTLTELLISLEIPDRPGAKAVRFPPYFQTVDRERRARMFDLCEKPGPLQDTVRQRWMDLFVMPAPPPYVPPEAFAEGFGKMIDARIADTAAAVARLRERGGHVVFVRFPVTGPLLQRENEMTPRAPFWDRIIRETQAPGIHFQDHPDLAGFDCPEWSHLSNAGSVEFTKRLVPHLKTALGR